MGTVVQETEKLISRMTRAEKAQVLQWIVQDLGATDAHLLQAYPSLRAEDLANAWAYVRTHPDEIARNDL